MADDGSGLAAEVGEGVSEGYLDGENAVLGSFCIPAEGIVQHNLANILIGFLLDQLCHIVEGGGENTAEVSPELVGKVETLTHFAVLSAEAGVHPHGSFQGGVVATVDVRGFCSLGNG